jgi:hypothetical protein
VALSDIISRLVDPILDKIKEALGPFGKIFELLGKFWTNLTHLFTDIQNLVDSILFEIQAWRSFKESLSFRTRVINVKSAIEKTEEFWREIVRAKDAVIDLWKQLRGKLETTGNPAEEAEEAIADIEGSGFKTILEKFPKLLKGAEKVLGFVAIVADALESIISAVADLQAIVNVLKDIREEIETGATIFLSQKNARRTVTLTDGTTMKIRTGNLHS